METEILNGNYQNFFPEIDPHKEKQLKIQRKSAHTLYSISLPGKWDKFDSIWSSSSSHKWPHRPDILRGLLMGDFTVQPDFWYDPCYSPPPPKKQDKVEDCMLRWLKKDQNNIG